MTDQDNDLPQEADLLWKLLQRRRTFFEWCNKTLTPEQKQTLELDSELNQYYVTLAVPPDIQHLTTESRVRIYEEMVEEVTEEEYQRDRTKALESQQQPQPSSGSLPTAAL